MTPTTETYVLLLYLTVINLIGFGSMGLDKRKAIRHAYRIPEASLFLIACIGGSLGSFLGMYTFRHKTRHWYFVVGMPVILIAQIILLVMTGAAAGLRPL